MFMTQSILIKIDQFPVLIIRTCITLISKYFNNFIFQSLSCVEFFVTPWTAACQASLSYTISLSLLKLMSTESMMPSNYLIFCCPLILQPSVFPSIRVSSIEQALHIRWPKYWSFSFSINPSSKYSGLISFKIDWFDLLAAQGTLKSLLQHHSQKFFILITTLIKSILCDKCGGKLMFPYKCDFNLQILIYKDFFTIYFIFYKIATKIIIIP